MLSQLHEDFPEWKLFGIDADSVMIDKAKEICNEAEYILSKGIPVSSIKNISQNSIINLSSVIHEVYSYSSQEEVLRFWHDLFETGAKYIAIRDLMLSFSAFKDADLNDVASVLSRGHEDMLRDFSAIWGSLRSQNNLLHFLMKYRYEDNWKREVRENYFPITVEQLLSMIPTERYKIVYFSHYILPHNRSKIMDDFGIELRDNTHVKILLQRK